MARAKAVFAAILSLALALGGMPVQAAELVHIFSAELAAPATVLPVLAPLAAPTLAASLGAYAPFPAAAPIAAAPLLPAREAAFAAGGSLRAMSAPQAAPESGRAFDGALAFPAASGVEPVRASAASSAAAPRLEPPSSAPKRARSTAGRFLRAAAVGAGASALAPWLWSATPTAGALMLFAVAVSPVAAAAALLLAARGARAAYRRLSASAPARVNAPPSRRAIRAAWALGAALGIALTGATAFQQRPIIESVHSVLDSRLPEDERVFTTEIPGAFFAGETARALAGSADGRAALARVNGRMPAFLVTERRQRVEALPATFFADATVRLLSGDSVGREVLDGLRDRGGAVRMPAFFVSYQAGSAARYTPPDAVYLSVQTIEAGGVTVAEFLRNPAAQAAYLEREQAIIVHELTHADQARRSPFNADTWTLLRTNASRLAAAIGTYASARPEAVPAPASAEPEPARASETKSAAQVSAAPVYLDAAEVAKSGLTVARFVNDAHAQKEYILGHQAELARALHAIPTPAAADKSAAVPLPPAASAAGLPAFQVSFGMIQEWEYEAYLTEHFYTHERLKADPAAGISSGDLAGYTQALVGFDDFLRSIDGYGIYAANFHGPSPYYARYISGMRARWDAHRVEANVLLARRALAARDPAAARGYLEQARRVAAEKGLPAPVLILPIGN